MVNVAFIGGPSSGKTVVAGLLYEAVTVAKSGMIKDHDFYPSNEDTDIWMRKRKYYDKFNLEMGADMPTLRYFRDNIITPLRSGEWPPATSEMELQLLSLDFRVPTFFGTTIFGTTKRFIGIYEIGGERIARILEIISSAKDRGTILSTLRGEEVLHTLLQSNVFVVLINSELCIPPSFKDMNVQEILKKQARNDFDTALLVTAIRNYKYHMGGEIAALAMLFTKHDMVSNILPLNNKKQYEDTITTTMRSTWTQNSYLLKEHNISNVGYFKTGVQTKYEEEKNTYKPQIPLRFYIRDIVDLLYWLIKIKMK